MSNNPTEPRNIEVFVNSFLDRVVDENASTSKSFTVLLPQGAEIQLLPTESNKSIKVKVFNLMIPNVLYNFPEKSSRVWFENLTTSDVSGFQIDTDRVYATPNDLMGELNTKAGVAGVDVSFSYNDTNKKVRITNNNTTDDYRLISSFRYALQEPILTFQDMNDRLGFSQNLIGSKIDASGGTLDGDGYINMNRTVSYYLALDEQSNYYSQSIVPSSPNSRRIIAQVPTGSYGTLSTFSYVSSEWYNIPKGHRVSSLRFILLDDEFEPIDLKNFPINMTLQIKIE
jgi:hypothetical protein